MDSPDNTVYMKAVWYVLCPVFQNRQQMKELRAREAKALSEEDYELGVCVCKVEKCTCQTVQYMINQRCLDKAKHNRKV